MLMNNPEGIVGKYNITSDGKIYSYQKKKMLGQYSNGKGYITVNLNNGTQNSKRFYVHRLVAIHFIDNPEDKHDINHIDGNKNNNKSSNLEWCTKSENIQHAYETGLFKKIFDKRDKNQKNWIGKKINTRTITGVTKEKNKVGNYKIIVRCDCGNELTMWQNDFLKGKNKRCRKCPK